MSKKQGGPRLKVSERALFQRINRKLKQDGKHLRTARTDGAEANVGHYFIVDTNRNVIAAQHVNLETLARELGILQPWEELEA